MEANTAAPKRPQEAENAKNPKDFALSGAPQGRIPDIGERLGRHIWLARVPWRGIKGGINTPLGVVGNKRELLPEI